MPLWTNRHPIPVPDEVYNGGVLSIVFKGHVWMVYDIENKSGSTLQTQIIVFNRDSEKITEMNSVYSNGSSGGAIILKLFTDDTNLYIVRVKRLEGRNKNWYLYKLHGSTWEHIITVSRPGIWTSIVVIKQYVYVFEYDTNPTNFVLKIDLVERSVVEIYQIPPFSMSDTITKYNDKLYLIQNNDGTLKVSEFNNGVLVEVAQQDIGYNMNEYMPPVLCADSNEFGGYVKQELTFQFRFLDFESLRWESERINLTWKDTDSYQVKSIMKMNQSLYTLVSKVLPEEQNKQFELHVLDFHPKLNSICLDDLTTRLYETDAQKLEDVKQQLPAQMRAKLEWLLEWKNEQKLLPTPQRGTQEKFIKWRRSSN